MTNIWDSLTRIMREHDREIVVFVVAGIGMVITGVFEAVKRVLSEIVEATILGVKRLL